MYGKNPATFLNHVFGAMTVKSFPKSFAELVQPFSDKIALSLEGKDLLDYPLIAVLVDFSNAYNRWPIHIGHSFVAFFRPNVTQNSKVMVTKRLGRKSH